MRVLRSLFPAMAWILEPTLPSEEGAGWGDLPELPKFGDCPPSPWDSDAECTLSQLQSPQPSILTPPPTPPSPPFPPPPPLTPASPIPSFTPHHAEMPTSPPRKIVPSNFPTPPLAAVTDPLTPRTDQLLRLPFGELNSRFDMGWSRYLFAMSRRGQVQTWQRGESVSRSHFLSRSLERARLIASATQPPKPRSTSLLPASISLPPLPYGQTTLHEVLAHRPPSCGCPTPRPPPPTHTTPLCATSCVHGASHLVSNAVLQWEPHTYADVARGVAPTKAPTKVCHTTPQSLATSRLAHTTLQPVVPLRPA